MASNKIKKICVMIGSRANYSSIKSFLEIAKKTKKIKTQIVLFSSAPLHRFGDLSKLINKDGFKINYILNSHVEGETLNTMVRSTALSMIDMPEIFKILKPDMVLTIGDRYETLAASITSAYLNIPLIHTMGGEVTGTIDEKVRHATTKLADIHFPATKDAKKRILRLGENKKNVFMVGCPRIDHVKQVLKNKINYLSLNNYLYKYGVGNKLDVRKPFCLVSYHPVTTEFNITNNNISLILKTLNNLKINTIVLWPNSDAGAEKISSEIRIFRENNKDLKNFRFFINLPTNIYTKLMSLTSCLIGNSSSGIREGSFIGTPVINVGSRQQNREHGKNVINLNTINQKTLKRALNYQLKKKKYKCEKIYGDGKASIKMIKILSKIGHFGVKKKISY